MSGVHVRTLGSSVKSQTNLRDSAIRGSEEKVAMTCLFVFHLTVGIALLTVVLTFVVVI